MGFLRIGCFLAAMSCCAAVRAESEARDVAGWKVHVSKVLLEERREETERALALIQGQLEEIRRVVPKAAVAELQKVGVWVSPEYAGKRPTAEYHPSPAWLKLNGRNVEMARGVEFSNVRTFEAECRRMPMLVLHELAHAYHHRVLGHGHAGIKAAYENARASGTYERVERRDSEGRRSMDRAYAMSNAQEYFAELSEAYFGRNDFFPYTREELIKHDPKAVTLLERVWRGPEAKGE